VVGNPVRDAVMPFVQAHVASPDWRAREAAVNAFAAIVAGPDPETTLPVVRSALGSLLTMIKDPARPVRRAAVFAVTYCLETLHAEADDENPPLLGPESLPPLLAVLDVRVLGSSLAAVAKLAAICYLVRRLNRAGRLPAGLPSLLALRLRAGAGSCSPASCSAGSSSTGAWARARCANC
jgi:HEAT repeat protein